MEELLAAMAAVEETVLPERQIPVDAEAALVIQQPELAVPEW